MNRRPGAAHSLRPVAHKHFSKQRLLHDRAQLLSALHDHRRGKIPDLPEPELAMFIEDIERRLANLEQRLRQLEA